MSTTTARKTVAGAYAEIANLRTEQAEGFARLEALIVRGMTAQAPATECLPSCEAGNSCYVCNGRARTAPVQAPEAPVTGTKPLSRGAWKALRTTRNGKVRAAFAGLTREQAFAKGLCEGFHLPTGERRTAIREYNAAK